MPASLEHIDSQTPMGATLVADGATFRVWAPNASAVQVRGAFNGFADTDCARRHEDAERPRVETGSLCTGAEQRRLKLCDPAAGFSLA